MSRSTTVFVLIDALGWKYIEHTRFLTEFLPYRQPLRTVLGYSSGAIPSILTGRPPSETGRWNLVYYAPEQSPFRWLKPFTGLPGPIIDHRVTRKLLKEAGRRFLGLGPLFECCVSPSLLGYFDWGEKKNIYQPGGLGSVFSIFDELSQAGVPFRSYSYHLGPDVKLIDMAIRDLETGAADFSFVYLSEVDHFLHERCTDQSDIESVLADYDRHLSKLFHVALERSPGARLAVASDHGMTPVRRHYDLMSEVEALGLNMPGDYLAVYDSTMARFWFFNSAARQAVTERLAGSPHGRILGDAELRSLGIYFEDERFGESVFLLDPGTLIARSNFNGPRWTPAGMHGYHPDDPYSDGVFLASEAVPSPLEDIRGLFGWMHGGY